MSEVKQAEARPSFKVPVERINALLQNVQYRVEYKPGTTTTLAHAFLNGDFLLDTGMSACVDPIDFDANRGQQMALDDARQKAENRLWVLEGYIHYCARKQQEAMAFQQAQEQQAARQAAEAEAAKAKAAEIETVVEAPVAETEEA